MNLAHVKFLNLWGMNDENSLLSRGISGHRQPKF